MYRLLSKDTPFQWSSECEENLKKLKKAVTDNETLAMPDLMDKEQSYRPKWGYCVNLKNKIVLYIGYILHSPGFESGPPIHNLVCSALLRGIYIIL